MIDFFNILFQNGIIFIIKALKIILEMEYYNNI